ncbi:hypothetical protein QT781_11825, partial [Xanthomonas citri pv. citri]
NAWAARGTERVLGRARSVPLAANPPGSALWRAETALRALPRRASLGRSARLVSTRHRTLRTHLNVHDTL